MKVIECPSAPVAKKISNHVKIAFANSKIEEGQYIFPPGEIRLAVKFIFVPNAQTCRLRQGLSTEVIE